jgi:hypothetical protein
MSDLRFKQIDDAVSAAGELIGLLLTKGDLKPGQARLIVEAAVRAIVPNFQTWEIRDSAKRIAAETGGRNADGTVG